MSYPTQQISDFLQWQANKFSGDHTGRSALSAAVTEGFKVGCSAAVQAFPADFCLSNTLLSQTATLN